MRGLCLTPRSQQDRGGDRTNSNTKTGQASALNRSGLRRQQGRERVTELAVAVDAEYVIPLKAHSHPR